MQLCAEGRDCSEIFVVMHFMSNATITKYSLLCDGACAECATDKRSDTGEFATIYFVLSLAIGRRGLPIECACTCPLIVAGIIVIGCL